MVVRPCDVQKLYVCSLSYAKLECFFCWIQTLLAPMDLGLCVDSKTHLASDSAYKLSHPFCSLRRHGNHLCMAVHLSGALISKMWALLESASCCRQDLDSYVGSSNNLVRCIACSSHQSKSFQRFGYHYVSVANVEMAAAAKSFQCYSRSFHGFHCVSFGMMMVAVI